MFAISRMVIATVTAVVVVVIAQLNSLLPTVPVTVTLTQTYILLSSIFVDCLEHHNCSMF